MSRRAARVMRIAGVLVVTGVVFWWFAAPRARSAAMLADLTGSQARWRALLPVGLQAITEEDHAVPTRHGVVAARAYRPVRPDLSLIIFPGIHAGGVDEPRLVALSRRVAASGALVLTVPLPDLRAYRITPRSTDAIEDAIRWMADSASLAPTGRIGVVGVSFAGGLAVVAAGRPGVSDRLTAILGLGVHADLPRVLRYLTTADAPASPGPPHDYGVVLLLRSALPLMVPPEQFDAADKAIVRFLDAASATSTDQAKAERLFAEARALGDALDSPARDLMDAVIARDVSGLGRRLAPLADRIGGDAALSPLRSPLPGAPVFLLHGATDTVVPAYESVALARALESAHGHAVEVLVTPLITHADPISEAPFSDGWRLVRFWTRLWNAFRP
jgi:dienelactone hydrolase